MKTVVGLYDTLADAKRVIGDLTDAGISANNINLLAGDPEDRYATQLAGEFDTYDEADAAVDGAVAGGVLGGLTGLLIGLGAFAIPGLGPVVAAGPLAAGLMGAGIGAAGGGLVAALVEWGVSEEEAEFYLEGVRRGGTLVAVKTPEERVDLVSDIMHQQGLIDLEERVSTWREEGWTGYEPGPYADMDFDTHDRAFRKHYEKVYADEDFPYDNYAPAYSFGYYLATDNRTMTGPWADVEPEARNMWEEEYGGDWDEHEEAVAYAYHRAQMYNL
jgi:hypothetical protein